MRKWHLLYDYFTIKTAYKELTSILHVNRAMMLVATIVFTIFVVFGMYSSLTEDERIQEIEILETKNAKMETLLLQYSRLSRQREQILNRLQQTAVSISKAMHESDDMQMILREKQNRLFILHEYYRPHSRLNMLTLIPHGTPTNGAMVSEFGMRKSPIRSDRGRVMMHTGVDIAGIGPLPIYSTQNGKVLYAGYAYGLFGGLGYVVAVSNGMYITAYGHMRKYVVRTDQAILRGQLLGYMGETGRATGNHLHYEVRDFTARTRFDPAEFMLDCQKFNDRCEANFK